MSELEIGATYRTSVATWKIDAITPDGIVFAIREDGKRGRLSASYLKERIVERVA